MARDFNPISTHVADKRHSEQIYRRGVLLGMTMAEILIVFLFCVLMSFILQREQLVKKNTDLEQAIAPEQLRAGEWIKKIADLTETSTGSFSDAWRKLEQVKVLLATLSADELAELMAAINDAHANPETGRADIKKLAESIRSQGQVSVAAAEITGEQGVKDKESAARLAGKLVRMGEDVKQLQSLGSRDVIAENQRLYQENAGLEDRSGRLDEALRAAKDQLAGKGRGLEYPSCFQTTEGKPEYIYDIEFNESNLTLLAIDLPHRAIEKAALPFASVRVGLSLSAEQFLVDTKPLYEWSVRNECRFFVRVTDKTDSANKQAYKSMKTTVQYPFYVFEPALYERAKQATP